MKSTFFTTLVVSIFFVSTACGQMGGDKSQRKSPPAKAEQKVGDATIVIDYSQPSVRGREIYGDLVSYGKVWRTGANEATTFKTDKDIMVNGKKLPAGKYALFTIPGEKEWTIIFNSEPKQWGAYKYDEKKDVLQVKAKSTSHDMTEKMTFTISEDGQVHLDWAKTRVTFKVN